MKNLIKTVRFDQTQLKLLAAGSMLIDHVGAVFFPGISVFRIVGRLAFPIFSYAIYEGCQHTRHKARYFFRIFGLGSLCVLGYYVFAGAVFGNVLITFSLSILVVFSIQAVGRALSVGAPVPEALGWAGLSAAVIISAFLICRRIEIDYGFLGVMLPAFAQLFSYIGQRRRLPEQSAKADRFALVGFGVGLLLLSVQMRGVQFCGLAALIPLYLSSGRRSEHDLKRFFYLFYPLHLIAIGAIQVFAQC